MEEAPNKRNAMDSLTDDVLVDILRCLPARSLCCCKCVCHSRKRIISDSDHRKELSQTVAGFFYRSWWNGNRHFTNITGERPSLSFLSFPLNKVLVSDCCSSLILCWCVGPDGLRRYVVCNPTTEKWLVLPRSIRSIGQACLGFDPTLSSHFHVIEFVEEEGACVGVEIYSSKIAAWIFKEYEWGEGIALHSKSRSVFLSGFMHMLEYSVIVAVDMEGKTWRTIPKPRGAEMSIHQAQGHLCLCCADFRNISQLLVWILEDYGTNKWRLKHVVSTQDLFGQINIEVGSELYDVDYRVITVHTEWNLIFFVGEDRTLIAYDMDRRKVHVIHARAIHFRRPRGRLHMNRPYYFPYVPLFMEPLAEQ